MTFLKYFLVERSSREVLNRVGVYLFRQGFGMPEGGCTDTTMLFTRSQVPQHKEGLLRRLLVGGFLDTAPSSLQWVRLVTSEVADGCTRLTVIDSSQEECPDIEAELEQLVVEKLGGT